MLQGLVLLSLRFFTSSLASLGGVGEWYLQVSSRPVANSHFSGLGSHQEEMERCCCRPSTGIGPVDTAGSMLGLRPDHSLTSPDVKVKLE